MQQLLYHEGIWINKLCNRSLETKIYQGAGWKYPRGYLKPWAWRIMGITQNHPFVYSSCKQRFGHPHCVNLITEERVVQEISIFSDFSVLGRLSRLEAAPAVSEIPAWLSTTDIADIERRRALVSAVAGTEEDLCTSRSRAATWGAVLSSACKNSSYSFWQASCQIFWWAAIARVFYSKRKRATPLERWGSQ